MKRILILTFAALLIFPPFAVAADDDVLTQCESKLSAYENKVREVTRVGAFENDLEFRVQLEQLRNSYHEYMMCVFGAAESALLSTSTDIFAARTGNIPTINQPDIACMNQSDLNKVIRSTGLANMGQQLLDVYYGYEAALDGLLNGLDGSILNFTELYGQNEAFDKTQQLQILIAVEKEESLIGLDNAMIMINDMRQAFLMHVHFQCMLKGLAVYRDLLEEIRELVSELPTRFKDAATSK